MNGASGAPGATPEYISRLLAVCGTIRKPSLCGNQMDSKENKEKPGNKKRTMTKARKRNTIKKKKNGMYQKLHTSNIRGEVYSMSCSMSRGTTTGSTTPNSTLSARKNSGQIRPAKKRSRAPTSPPVLSKTGKSATTSRLTELDPFARRSSLKRTLPHETDPKEPTTRVAESIRVASHTSLESESTG